MELFDEKSGKTAYTAHASKQSKIDFKIFTAHSSAMLPMASIFLYPSMFTLKLAFGMILILILVERRGWTVGLAFKRIRSKWAGKRRVVQTRHQFIRRVKTN